MMRSVVVLVLLLVTSGPLAAQTVENLPLPACSPNELYDFGNAVLQVEASLDLAAEMGGTVAAVDRLYNDFQDDLVVDFPVCWYSLRVREVYDTYISSLLITKLYQQAGLRASSFIHLARATAAQGVLQIMLEPYWAGELSVPAQPDL